MARASACPLGFFNAAGFVPVLYPVRGSAPKVQSMGVSQSFGVYPTLSLRAAYAPPNRRWADDPERDCREAEAPVEGRFQGPALRGDTDPAGRLVVPALP